MFHIQWGGAPSKVYWVDIILIGGTGNEGGLHWASGMLSVLSEPNSSKS
jgi:hypothetical protein